MLQYMQGLQEIIDQFTKNLQTKTVTEDHLGELRRRCTQGQKAQQQICEGVVGYMHQLLDIIISYAQTRRQERRESLFLQLLNNMVVASPHNAEIVCESVCRNYPYQRLSRLFVLLGSTEKNRRLGMTFIYNLLFQLRTLVSWEQMTTIPNLGLLCRVGLSDIHNQEESTFQWKTFLLCLLFNWPKADSQSTIKFLIQIPRHPHDLMMMLAILLQKVIDSKTTATLVSGLLPSNPDIIQMHTVQKKTVSFMLNVKDVQFLEGRFKTNFESFKQDIRHIVDQGVLHTEQLSQHFQWLNDALSMFGHTLFLGGYNANVQAIFNRFVPLVCQYLQVIYLIFTLCDVQLSTRTLTLTTQQQAAMSLSTLWSLLKLESEQSVDAIQRVYPSLYTIEMFAITLKFLTNCIHINLEVIKHFQQNPKYLYMIMSLTRMNTSQPTMREWSLMFIRNACSMSEHIQGLIGELKVDLKSQ